MNTRTLPHDEPRNSPRLVNRFAGAARLLLATLSACSSPKVELDTASTQGAQSERPGDVMISPPMARGEEDVARTLLRSFEGLDVTRRSIDLTELTVGQRPDGIPAIDRPQFDGVHEAARWLHPQEPVVVVTRGADARAYPLQILIWHEIVNDAVGGARWRSPFARCATPRSPSTALSTGAPSSSARVACCDEATS